MKRQVLHIAGVVVLATASFRPAVATIWR